MGHNQSFKQSNNVPNIRGSQMYRAARLDGPAKNRGIKNTKKPSKGK